MQLNTAPLETVPLMTKLQDSRILLVDDDRDILGALKDLLEPEVHLIETADEFHRAEQIAAVFQPDIALLDIKLGTANGLDLIPKLKEQSPDIACIVMTGFASTDNAVQAVRNGADDYLYKPVDPVGLMRILERCRRQQCLERDAVAAAAALRDSERHIRAIMENVADSLVTINQDGAIQSINSATLRVFGYEAEELIGENVSILVPGLQGVQHDGYIVNYLCTGEGKIIGKGPREVTGLRKDGTTANLELAISETYVEGKHLFIGAMRDITERKRLEDQLHQAQKMEAVGQLTGGVAHDFNNLLGVIMGNTELLEERVGAGDQQVQAVLRAATRGAELTGRLLAFSRLQPLRPKHLDLSQLVIGMSDLLRRTLGETINISTETDGGQWSGQWSGLWEVEADPGQVENVLLNLAINSGHAMPSGGDLDIKTSNIVIDEIAAALHGATPGDYAVLEVSDNGFGMPPEVAARAFEPFFTTKDVGEGSGLGLSMVYGFAQQSHGFVTIGSEPGRGTRVSLFLPRALGGAAADERTTEAPTDETGDETILVVEDDPAMRSLAAELIASLGYKVLAAENGSSALALLRENDDIDLILMDVVLSGGMSGPDLAEVAQRRETGIKILLMSGYPNGVGSVQDTPLDGFEILSKPFRKRDLAQKIRDILDGTPA